jgi:hypothetical protein
MSSVLTLISSLFEPAVKLIDEMHTSDEERIDAKTKMQVAFNDLSMAVVDYEGRLVEARGGIIKAEAESKHWLTANWRPITMLTFLFLVVMDAFKLLPNPLASEAWTLLQIGLGGYVVGRSGEKIIKSVKQTGG